MNTVFLWLWLSLLCFVVLGILVMALGRSNAPTRQTTRDARSATSAKAHSPTDTATLIQQLQAINAAANRHTTAKADETVMTARAKRLYEKTIAETRTDNRGHKSRPPGPYTLQIAYVDVDGVYTTRNVAPYKSGNTNERFDAWCDLRQERRTFLFSRVQSGKNLLSHQRLDRAKVFLQIHPQRKVPTELR